MSIFEIHIETPEERKEYEQMHKPILTKVELVNCIKISKELRQEVDT